MRFTIFQLGHTPEPMQDEFDRVPPQFQDMLRPVFDQVEFETCMIVDGEPVPQIDDVSAAILTGSAFGTYDHTEWMQPVRDFIRHAYDRATPMLGVCFGHQLIADALGGTVVKSDRGWGIGRHEYMIDGQAIGEGIGKSTIALAASHQDQVVKAPSSARTFLSSDFTPHAGLVYDNDRIITVQPHPEFDIAYSKALCRLRLNNPLSQDEVDACESSLNAGVENERMSRIVVDFLTR